MFPDHPRDEWPGGFAAIYFQEQRQASPGEPELIVERLQKFASAEGLTVTEVFIEPLDSRADAIAHKAMVRILRARRDRYLIVPGVHHFADLGRSHMEVLADLLAMDVQVIFAGHVE